MDSNPTTISLTSRRPHLASAAAADVPRVAGSIALSMPEVLRRELAGHGGKARKAASVAESDDGARGRKEGAAAAAGMGKRRRRRFENAQFFDNPHTTRPTLRDYDPRPSTSSLPTFPFPAPSSFPSKQLLPPISPSPASPADNLHGQFHLSLRGVRRNLRKSTGHRLGEGGRVEELIVIIETSLREWLLAPQTSSSYHSTTSPPVVLDPTATDDLLPRQATLSELSRSAASILWVLPDPYARYLTHVLARYYNLPSFSKPVPGEEETRVTWILRPQIVRPLRGTGVGMDTPPATEAEISARSETEGDTAESSAIDRGDLESLGDSESEFGEEVSGNVLGSERRSDGRVPEGESEEDDDYTDDEASSIGDGSVDEGGEGNLFDSIESLPPRPTSPSSAALLPISTPSKSTIASTPSTPISLPRPFRSVFPPPSESSPSGTSTPTPSTPGTTTPTQRRQFGSPLSFSTPASSSRVGRSPLLFSHDENGVGAGATGRRDESEESVFRASDDGRGRGKLGVKGVGSVKARFRRTEWKLPARTFIEFLFGEKGEVECGAEVI